MATLREAIVRVKYEYTGSGAARRARSDTDQMERGAERLNIALAAAAGGFLKFSHAAVKSFADIEFAMARFASRAGWTLRQFTKETEDATHNIARLTGVRHGLIIQAVQEGISQGALQGMQVPEIINLVKQGAKLHSSGQTNLLQAVSSAITSRQYGAPSAPFGQRLIYSASQVGAGNPAEYGKEYKDIAPGGALLNIEQSESLGALALIAGAAPSLAEGATWIKALYRTISNPMEDAENMFRERMGMEWKVLQDMLSDRGGLVKALTLLRDNFTGVEITEMFGRQEAVQGLTALTEIPGQLLRLQNAVRENAIDDPVQRAWRDNAGTWRITIERFRRAVDSFLRSFGEPLLVVMKPFVNIARNLVSLITAFNEWFLRIPSYLIALTGALIGVTAAINLWRTSLGIVNNFLQGVQRAGGAGGFFGGRSDADWTRREDERDERNRRNRNWNTAAEAGVDAAVTGGAAWGARRAFKHVEEAIKGSGAASSGLWDEVGIPGSYEEYSDFFDHATKKRNFRNVFYGNPDADGNYSWWMDPEDLRQARAAWMKREGRTLGSGQQDGARWSMFGDGWAAGRERDYGVGPSRRRTWWEGRGAGGWMGDGRANWTGSMFEAVPEPSWLRKRLSPVIDILAGVGLVFKDIGKDLLRIAVSDVGAKAFKATLAGALGGAVIAGFQWWYRKTAKDYADNAYDPNSFRTIGSKFLKEKDKSLSDLQSMGDIDVDIAKAQQAAELKGEAMDAYREALDDAELPLWLSGDWLHRFTSWWKAAEEERGAILEKDQSLIDAKRALIASKALGAEDARIEALEQQIAMLEEDEKWYSWFTKLLYNFRLGRVLPEKFKPNASDGAKQLRLRGMRVDPAWREEHGGLFNGGLSPSLIRGAESYIAREGHLPTWIPSRPTYKGAVGANASNISQADSFYRRLNENPNMGFVINIGTMNEATPKELTDTIKRELGHPWGYLGDHADAESF